jgi:hypothetical protein
MVSHPSVTFALEKEGYAPTKRVAEQILIRLGQMPYN